MRAISTFGTVLGGRRRPRRVAWAPGMLDDFIRMVDGMRKKMEKSGK